MHFIAVAESITDYTASLHRDNDVLYNAFCPEYGFLNQASSSFANDFIQNTCNLLHVERLVAYNPHVALELMYKVVLKMKNGVLIY